MWFLVREREMGEDLERECVVMDTPERKQQISSSPLSKFEVIWRGLFVCVRACVCVFYLMRFGMWVCGYVFLGIWVLVDLVGIWGFVG